MLVVGTCFRPRVTVFLRLRFSLAGASAQHFCSLDGRRGRRLVKVVEIVTFQSVSNSYTRFRYLYNYKGSYESLTDEGILVNSLSEEVSACSVPECFPPYSLSSFFSHASLSLSMPLSLSPFSFLSFSIPPPMPLFLVI